MKEATKNILRLLPGYPILRRIYSKVRKSIKRLLNKPRPLKTQQLGEKAGGDDILGRFRETIADPTNLLIAKDPKAGFVQDGHVFLHNGLKAPITGPRAYYNQAYCELLAINRGVHEPLEEYVFQQVLKKLPENPVMLELGAYWAHYSMWLKAAKPGAQLYLVEPSPWNLEAAKYNFQNNGLQIGELFNVAVKRGEFEVDEFMTEQRIDTLHILHADIQGYELEMLECSAQSLKSKRIEYLLISTHGEYQHQGVTRILKKHGYTVEVSSDFEHHTTSYDGFVFARSPDASEIMPDFSPIGRTELLSAQPGDLLDFLNQKSVTKSLD